MRRAMVTLVVLASSQAVSAQALPGGAGTRVAVGAGVIAAPRPYVGATNQTRAIPLIELSAERFSLQGIRAGYRLVEGDGLDLDLRLRARFGGLDPDDSPALAGMEARSGTAEAGLALGIDLGGPWRATALVRVQRLADQFQDSPIIDRRWGTFGLLGVTYEF